MSTIIYLSSVVLSAITTFYNEDLFKTKLEEEGYENTDSNKSLKKLWKNIKTILLIIIPIVNLIIPCVFALFNREEIYNEYKKHLQDKGKIIKIDNENDEIDDFNKNDLVNHKDNSLKITNILKSNNKMKSISLISIIKNAINELSCYNDASTLRSIENEEEFVEESIKGR